MMGFSDQSKYVYDSVLKNPRVGLGKFFLASTYHVKKTLGPQAQIS